MRSSLSAPVALAAALFFTTGCAVSTDDVGRAAQAEDSCPDLGFVSCKVHDSQADCILAPGSFVYDSYTITLALDQGGTSQFVAPSKTVDVSQSGTAITLYSDQWNGVRSFTVSGGSSTSATKVFTVPSTVCNYPKCTAVVLCPGKPPTGPNDKT